MKVEWPLIDGLGHLECNSSAGTADGSACYNVTFPVPDPLKPYSLHCSVSQECMFSHILCPTNASCDIACSFYGSCYEATIICPTNGDYECNVNLSSWSGATGAQIYCSSDTNCNVRCIDQDACLNVEIFTPTSHYVCDWTACNLITEAPTTDPSESPTLQPTYIPTTAPTDDTKIPTTDPSTIPTIEPTAFPTTNEPTVQPTSDGEISGNSGATTANNYGVGSSTDDNGWVNNNLIIIVGVVAFIGGVVCIGCLLLIIWGIRSSKSKKTETDLGTTTDAIDVNSVVSMSSATSVDSDGEKVHLENRIGDEDGEDDTEDMYNTVTNNITPNGNGENQEQRVSVISDMYNIDNNVQVTTGNETDGRY